MGSDAINKEFTGYALYCSRFPGLRLRHLEGKQQILRLARFSDFESDRGASCCRVQGAFELSLLLRRVGPLCTTSGGWG